MKMNKILFLMTVLGLSITSCNGSNSSQEPEPDKHVDVFVLSGQSNMEGSTYWKHPDGTPLLERKLYE